MTHRDTTEAETLGQLFVRTFRRAATSGWSWYFTVKRDHLNRPCLHVERLANGHNRREWYLPFDDVGGVMANLDVPPCDEEAVRKALEALR